MIKNGADDNFILLCSKLTPEQLEEIKKVADRCAILCRGKLIDILDVATASTKEMANLMVGREVSFETVKKEPVFQNEILKVENMTVKNNNGFDNSDNKKKTRNGCEHLQS